MKDAPGYRRFLTLPESDRALLRDRARETAAPAKADEEADLLGILEFESAGQLFALPLEVIEGIVELQMLAPVPRAPAVVRGLVIFRGEVLLGADPSRLFGASTGMADLRRIIAIAADGKRLALLTPKALTVRTVERNSFKPTESAGPSPVLGLDARCMALLDPATLIADIFAAVEARRS